MSTDKLRGMKVPTPRFISSPFPDSLKAVNGYSNLQTYFPTFSHVFRVNKFQSETAWFDTPKLIDSIDCSGANRKCSLVLRDTKTSEKTTVDAFMKVTHLLDPVRWMHGGYSLPKEVGLPWHGKSWTSAWHKLQDPWNQAYVETLATYSLSRLVDANITPHFNNFYGGFCARANTYKFNINDDFESYRETRWFWKGTDNGLFKLKVVNTEDERSAVDQDILDELLDRSSVKEDAAVAVEDNNDSEEELETDDLDVDNASLYTDSLGSKEFEEEDSSSSSSVSSDNKYSVNAEIPNFPVMLIFTELNENTMDSLLSLNFPEDVWSAWLFQVVSACCVMQAVLGMTHNDLHTNNIVWSETDIEFLYYRTNSGKVWKVPTYGKLFRLIDFGRSIFTINGKMFVSDDFRVGNDAGDQYSFKPLVSHPRSVVAPNPSFDLARLSVSIFEAIFPQRPAEAESKKILSEEEGLVIRESVSSLYNILWTWMVDDEDKNILMNPDGSERFPDFDLYKHIAAHIHNADPSEQIYKAPFCDFITREAVPDGVKVYPLMV